MNYEAVLNTITVNVFGGAQFTGQDTPTSRNASNAIYDYEHNRIIRINWSATSYVLVPFHGIKSVIINKGVATSFKPDAYCGDDASFKQIWEGEQAFTYQQMAGLYDCRITTEAWTPVAGKRITVTYSDGTKETAVLTAPEPGSSAYSGALPKSGRTIKCDIGEGTESTYTYIMSGTNPGVSVTKLEVEE